MSQQTPLGGGNLSTQQGVLGDNSPPPILGDSTGNISSLSSGGSHTPEHRAQQAEEASLGSPQATSTAVPPSIPSTGTARPAEDPIIRDADGNVIAGRISSGEVLSVPGTDSTNTEQQVRDAALERDRLVAVERERVAEAERQRQLNLDQQQATDTSVVPPFEQPPPNPDSVPQRPTFEAPLTPGPGTGFQVDPRDSEKVLASLSHFVNAMFNSQQPGLTSGSFTNPNQTAEGLQDLFTNSGIGPDQFFQFLNQLQGFSTDSPFGNQLNQTLSGQLSGAGNQQQNDLISSLFSQPSTQSLSTGRSSRLLESLAQEGGGTGSPLQGFVDEQLRSQIQGGGISEDFVNAARERILKPSNEALQGRLNRQGGGVASLDSGLFQELQRRQESDFNNDLILFGGGNQQNALSQAGALGQQQFGNLFGVGQAQGQLGQNQQQINQQAFGLGGQLQGQLANQGLQATQLGLGREQFTGDFQQGNTGQALQFLQLMNLFGLGQTDIASSLTRQLLGGAQIANPKGSFLNSLIGGVSTGLSAIPGAG